MVLFKAEYEFKVPFEDVDMMGIVWHGNYIKYLEHSRCDLFSKLNYTYMNMKADNYAYPVAKMKIKYIQPAKFDDILVVISEIIEIEPALIIKYVIYDKNKKSKILEASTMQIAIDINTQKSLYVAPEKLSKIIKERMF